jgi:hypothetical protein
VCRRAFAPVPQTCDIEGLDAAASFILGYRLAAMARSADGHLTLRLRLASAYADVIFPG